MRMEYFDFPPPCTGVCYRRTHLPLAGAGAVVYLPLYASRNVLVIILKVLPAGTTQTL